MKKYQTVQIISGLFFAFAVIYAVLPLFGKRYIPTHDGEYHIIRIVEFSRMLGSGNLFPRWAPTLNSGYGVPVFQYNYALPNYIGSFLRLFTHDAVYAFQTAMGVGYIILVIGIFLWLRSIFGVYPALIGATVGAFVPYIFVDMYVRGSIGEIWATALLAFSLFFIERKRYVLFAFSYACLILSHNILGMLYTPFLLLYTLLRDKKALWSILGGAGMSAFFWVPALMEQQYVTGLNTVNFREHFVEVYEFLIPSWGSQFSATGSFGSKISFQFGLAPMVSFFGALLMVRRISDKKKKNLFLLFAGVALGSILFMTRLSQPLWEILTPLQNVQYPWRLLSFIIPIASFAAALWMYALKKKWVGLVVAVFAVFFALSYTRPATYEPRSEAYYLSRQNFTDGTSSMGNSFSSVWTGWKDTRPKSEVDIQNGQMIEKKRWEYMDKEFIVSMNLSGIVTINTLYFPGWVVTVDGREEPIQYRQDGIMHVAVSEGVHAVQVKFTNTLPRKVGISISIASLVGTALWAILRIGKAKTKTKKKGQ